MGGWKDVFGDRVADKDSIEDGGIDVPGKRDTPHARRDTVPDLKAYSPTVPLTDVADLSNLTRERVAGQQVEIDKLLDSADLPQLSPGKGRGSVTMELDGAKIQERLRADLPGAKSGNEPVDVDLEWNVPAWTEADVSISLPDPAPTIDGSPVSDPKARALPKDNIPVHNISEASNLLPGLRKGVAATALSFISLIEMGEIAQFRDFESKFEKIKMDLRLKLMLLYNSGQEAFQTHPKISTMSGLSHAHAYRIWENDLISILDSLHKDRTSVPPLSYSDRKIAAIDRIVAIRKSRAVFLDSISTDIPKSPKKLTDSEIIKRRPVVSGRRAAAKPAGYTPNAKEQIERNRMVESSSAGAEERVRSAKRMGISSSSNLVSKSPVMFIDSLTIHNAESTIKAIENGDVKITVKNAAFILSLIKGAFVYLFKAEEAKIKSGSNDFAELTNRLARRESGLFELIDKVVNS